MTFNWILLPNLLLCFFGFAAATSSSSQQLQCYACGMPNVHPENDIVGSYGIEPGKKMYNHSCTELVDMMVDGNVDNRFLRTCPVGVRSCFGAVGFYDHRDQDPSNDLKVQFLGCSETKYRHTYGCDQEYQNVNITDKAERKMQVEINVKLCFCSEARCNHPDGELLNRASGAQVKVVSVAIGVMVAIAANHIL